MNPEIVFSHAEVLDIREQYVARIEKLERQNEELELMLRRALNQVRAMSESVRRSIEDTSSFESALVKMVDECEVLAVAETVAPRVVSGVAGVLPKVIVSDMPTPAPVVAKKPAPIAVVAKPVVAKPALPVLPALPVIVAKPAAMRAPARSMTSPQPSHANVRPARSVFTAQTVSGPMAIPPVPAVPPLRLVEEHAPIDVSDDMVIEDAGVTVVAAKVAAPVLSSPMPGAAQNVFWSTSTSRGKAPARLRPSA